MSHKNQINSILNAANVSGISIKCFKLQEKGI